MFTVVDEGVRASEAVPSTQPASVRTWVNSPVRRGFVGRPEVFLLMGSSEEEAVCRQPQSMRVVDSPRSIPDREPQVQLQDVADTRIGATVEETPVASLEAMGSEGSCEGDIAPSLRGGVSLMFARTICLTPTALGRWRME